MTKFNRAWFIRIGLYALASQPIGYLLSIVLHDRYSIDVCALLIVGVFLVLDEIRLFVDNRNTTTRSTTPSQSRLA